MIEISDCRLFGKDGILLKHDGKKEIFFTNAEAGKLRDFLNERKANLRSRILTILESKKVTLGYLTKELNIDKDIINEELMSLEFEGRIGLEGKNVDHWDVDTVMITVFKEKE